MDSVGDRLDDLFIQNLERRQARNRKLNTVLFVYVAIGVVTATTGILLFLSSSSSPGAGQPALGNIQIFLIVPSGVLALISIVVLSIRRFSRISTELRFHGPPAFELAQYPDVGTSAVSFLRSWHAFERAASAALQKSEVQPPRLYTATLLRSLSDAHLLGATDIEQLRRLINLRNSIVHDVAVHVPPNACEELETLRTRLTRARSNPSPAVK